jgi:hypothetical protein
MFGKPQGLESEPCATSVGSNLGFVIYLQRQPSSLIETAGKIEKAEKL